MSDEPLGERERRMFDAARAERPRSDVRARAIELALRAPAVAPPSRLRLTLVLVAAGFVGIFGLFFARSREPLIGAEGLHSASATGRAPALRVPASALPVAPEATASAPARRVLSASAPPSSVPPLRTLEEETAALGHVQEALRAGKPDAALALLDRYGRAAPAGSLAAEASLLRIQALSKAGKGAAASDLARKFVSTYPNSPLVDRAREYSMSPDAGDALKTDGESVERPGGTK